MQKCIDVEDCDKIIFNSNLLALLFATHSGPNNRQIIQKQLNSTLYFGKT